MVKASAVRSEGEVVRIRHALERLRSTIEAVEVSLKCPGPPGVADAQAVLEAAGVVTIGLAKLDAYRRAEDGWHCKCT